jgi:hypothetical protein
MEGLRLHNALPTPPLEARRLLHPFAVVVADRRPGLRTGTSSPEALGLAGRMADLRVHDAPHFPSSSAEGPNRC